MDSGRLQPALLGGLFIGVLSALPIIQAGNCCCCLWVLGGGVLTMYLRQQNAPIAIEAAEGALLGLMAGAIGGVIYVVLSIPIQMLFGPIMVEWMVGMIEKLGEGQDLPPDLRGQMERMHSGASLLFNLVYIPIYAVFGLLGGLLGVAIFKKNVPPPQSPTVIPHDPGLAQ
jgi:hypothetical protein